MSIVLQPETQWTEPQRSVWSDILSQSITGELIGMLNFATLAGIELTVDDALDAVEHANSERTHAEAFRAVARELGVTVIEDPAAPYWKQIRTAFQRHAMAGDRIGCLVIQELMLETFAVSMYGEIAAASSGLLARTFGRIAHEEELHLEHCMSVLAAERARDPQAFDELVEAIHDEVMTVLATMIAKEDDDGPCGLCHDVCVKAGLREVGLDLCVLRGRALNRYLVALDTIGVPGERSMRWTLRLPR